MSRRCADCCRDLPESSYYFVSKTSGKLRGQCKDCMRQRKLEQRDPDWTPSCSRCGSRLSVRAGSGRRLCEECFAQTYDTAHPRVNGAHRIKLKPCSLCGGRKERFERGKVCRACRPWLRFASSLRQFGLTPAEYMSIFDAQGGRCYVCGAPPGAIRLSIDHDHSISEMRRSIRGLLCNECNYSRLPRFQDDVGMLQRAVSYLVHPPAQSALADIRHPEAPAPPPPEGVVFFPEIQAGADPQSERSVATASDGHHVASRPGEPPVGSQRRPGARGTSTRSTGRTSGARRREQAGEGDA
ncbi:Recombination endonuclease VII [Blastococcus aggregatus]|uniref:Recombination endonuclease VII n=1 Tax=Blastococcus aggregatus TaxID=38502 RepID=A0A285V5X9_9ACTN|nr:Recombination endonuclease VII [Blastococcus aggregatus]